GLTTTASQKDNSPCSPSTPHCSTPNPRGWSSGSSRWPDDEGGYREAAGGHELLTASTLPPLPGGPSAPPHPLFAWQAVPMTDGKPEPTPAERVTAAMDEFMATVLRHLRTGQGSPLEELGLDKAREELQHWRPDIPGAGTEPGQHNRA